MTQEKILNIVVAGIRKEDKWLFIKRKRGDYQHKWALVGGKMQFSEKIEEALLREIKEETNLIVKWEGVKAILNERLKNKETGLTTKHFMLLLCLTSAIGGNIRETAEGKLRWFTKEELAENEENIIPSDYYMMEKLILNKSLDQVVEVELIENDEVLSIGHLEKY